MNDQMFKKPLIIVFIAIIFISVSINVKLLSDRSKGYDSVRCVECFKRTNDLVDSGQSLGPSEDTYLTGETVEELIPQIAYASPWMCEKCVYESAEHFAGI